MKTLKETVYESVLDSLRKSFRTSISDTVKYTVDEFTQDYIGKFAVFPVCRSVALHFVENFTWYYVRDFVGRPVTFKPKEFLK